MISVTPRTSSSERGKSRKQSAGAQAAIPANLPGILVSLVFVLLEVWFYVRLKRMNLLPNKYMLMVAAVLIVLAALVAVLCWSFKRKTSFIIGLVLALLAGTGFAIGTRAANRIYSTIKDMEASSTAVRQVDMGLYVRKDDAAQAMEDIREDVIGIVRDVDREESEIVLGEIAGDWNGQLQVITYNSFMEAAQALVSGEVRSIILDDAYIEVIAAIPAFEKLPEQLRKLSEHRVEVVKTEPADPKEPSGEENTTAPSKDSPVPATKPPFTIINPFDDTSTAPEETTEESRPEESSNQSPGTTARPAPPPTTRSTVAQNINVPAGQEGRIFTIYISGSDSKIGLSSKAQSDVNILAVVNMNTKQILLINTPRDYYVLFSVYGGSVRDKLTHIGWYGPQAAIDTLKILYGVTANYYFKVDFNGFKKIVDALGGITAYSYYTFDITATKTVTTYSPATDEAGEIDESAESIENTEQITEVQYSFVTGYNEMDGAKALAFVRDRALPGGDRTRGQHQMSVLKAIARAASSSSVLMNYGSLLDSLSGSFETTLPYEITSSLIQGFVEGGWSVVSYGVSGSDSNNYCPALATNAYVMWPNFDMVEYARNLIRRVYNGEAVSP